MMAKALFAATAALVLVVLSRGEAQAYIDPNTGGYVFQILFPVISAIAAGFVFCRDGIMKLFRKIFKRQGRK